MKSCRRGFERPPDRVDTGWSHSAIRRFAFEFSRPVRGAAGDDLCAVRVNAWVENPPTGDALKTTWCSYRQNCHMKVGVGTRASSELGSIRAAHAATSSLRVGHAVGGLIFRTLFADRCPSHVRAFKRTRAALSAEIMARRQRLRDHVELNDAAEISEDPLHRGAQII